MLGENFRQFCHLLSQTKIYRQIFFPVLMIAYDAAFTVLVRINSTKYSCSTKVAGFGKIFPLQNISAIMYFVFYQEYKQLGVTYSSCVFLSLHIVDTLN